MYRSRLGSSIIPLTGHENTNNRGTSMVSDQAKQQKALVNQNYSSFLHSLSRPSKMSEILEILCICIDRLNENLALISFVLSSDCRQEELGFLMNFLVIFYVQISEHDIAKRDLNATSFFSNLLMINLNSWSLKGHGRIMMHDQMF